MRLDMHTCMVHTLKLFHMSPQTIAHGLKYKINFDGSKEFVIYLGCV